MRAAVFMFLAACSYPELPNLGGDDMAVMPDAAEDRAASKIQISRTPLEGVVTSSVSGIDCGTNCEATVANGSEVTLTAKEKAGWYFQEWTGPCSGSARTCTFVVGADTVVGARFSKANLAFTTGGTFTPVELIARGAPIVGIGTDGAKLIAGADATCKAAITAPGALLEGQTTTTWLAFISITGTPARSRFTNARGWIRTDGKPFADQMNALLGNLPIFYPLEFEEHGIALPPDVSSISHVQALTGTMPDGTVGNTCVDWSTLSSSGGGAGAGEYTSGGGSWAFAGTAQCLFNRQYRLYCLQNDHETVLNFTPETGRVAFISETIAATAGLAAFDQRCQTEATAKGLSGSFKALVAPNSNQTSGSRFSKTGAPWVRIDGVKLVNSSIDMFSGAKLLASLNVTTAGQQTRDNAWVGATSAYSTGGLTCTNWSTASGQGHSGSASTTDPSWAGGGFAGCSGSLRLYCLQE